MERRLAAILAADVAGYSRLMDADEVDTFERLRAHRKELFEPEIEKHHGRIFKLMGDGMLAEFRSVVDAVECAVVLQAAMAQRNGQLANDRRIDVRIGINLGDVMIEGDDLIGDGVNVAARLQGLAQPGGIHISGNVYEQIRNKLPFVCEDLGVQSLKNIPAPVRVYRVQARAWPRAGSPPLARIATRLISRFSRARAFAVLSVVALFAAAIATYLLVQPPPQCTRAAIAVLPFANLSGDPTQSYFSDGTTEDITLALGRFSDLAVTANVAVQAYKGKTVRPSEISRDLGVCYILTGSTRKSGDQVLVTAELTDARNGQHLDSYSYDGELKDVFAVRDKIAQNVVGKLAIKLNDLEKQRAFKKPTGSLEAYDYLLRGREAYARDTRSTNMQARKMFEQAIQADPFSASAYAALGWTHLKAAVSGWTEFREEALQQAEDLARKAIEIDGDNADAHRLLGAVYFNRSQFDLAIVEYDRAIVLNPNDALSYVTRGSILTWTGHAREAIKSFEVAKQLNPGLGSGRLEPVGWAYYLDRRYKDAVTAFESGLRASPNDYFVHAGLAASYAQLDQLGDATRAAAATMHAFPFFEVNGFASQSQAAEDRALIMEGLHRAGLK
jgi:adenylate cyclase